MPKGKSNEDITMLSMALLGYQSEKQRIEEKIQEIQSRLSGRVTAAAPRSTHKVEASAPTQKNDGRRTLSAAARKRIAAAQKKRWAEHRKLAAANKE